MAELIASALGLAAVGLFAAAFVPKIIDMRVLIRNVLKWLALLHALRTARTAPTTPAQPAPAPSRADIEQEVTGAKAQWLRVFTGQKLLQLVDAQETMEALLRESRLSRLTFERDFLPAVLAYAEFTQLFPASEAHHHAHRGGLLGHTLEVVLAAMKFRNGYLLPKGGTAEDVAHQRDWWTYAVFYAALLHDVGKPIADLRITWVGPRGKETLRWMPIAGSLVDCSAREYLVGFAPKAERDYTAHAKLGVILLQRMASRNALSFLAQQPAILQELTQFLGGDGRQSVLAEIVKRADQLSTSRNLVQGTRARFSTATTMPLHELLQSAMVDLLRQGALPLNRDGAAGWVFDGAVWFVAKRLADTLREHIRKHAGDDAGVPGDAKNDRLFDTWQDFGMIQLSPQGKAIWYATVHGQDGDGYAHRLSLLRFPLAKLWDDPTQYPAVMNGRIEPHLKDEGRAPDTEAVLSAPAVDADESTAQEMDQKAMATAVVDADDLVDQAQQAPNASGAAPGGGEPANPKPAAAPKPAAIRGPKPVSVAGPKQTPTPAPTAKPQAAAPAAGGADAPPSQPSAIGATPSATSATIGAAKKKPPVDFDLDESCLGALSQGEVPAFTGRAAQISPKLPGKQPAAAPPVPSEAIKKSSPAPAARPQQAQPQQSAATPVALPGPALPKLPGDAKGAGQAKKASPMAIAFMQWLQHGLQTREILYNQSGAPVHFVPQGMILVSPAIFRRYAEENEEAAPEGKPDRLGLNVQREFMKAGWHLPSAEGNIWQFSVLKRGGIASSRLSAVVLGQPERWVVPVPPPNPALKLAEPSSSRTKAPG
jgi:integrating conjugative element relaxase (TIGR03760 family)